MVIIPATIPGKGEWFEVHFWSDVLICDCEEQDSFRRTINSLTAFGTLRCKRCQNRECSINVLEELGVDAKHGPEPLLFKSVGEESRQINHGKVYSGLCNPLCDGYLCR